MLVQSPSAFPVLSGQIPVNLTDQAFALNAANTSQWTPGATLLAPVELTPNLQQSWHLLSVSVTAQLALFNQLGRAGLGSVLQPVYGRLGRLVMALLLAQPTASVGGGPISPMLPLPFDASLSATLWDGTQDPTPAPGSTYVSQQPGPWIPPSSTINVAGTVSPPAPVPILPGGQLAVGIWLTPSLLAAAGGQVAGAQFAPGLAVINATFDVNYDNGS